MSKIIYFKLVMAIFVLSYITGCATVYTVKANEEALLKEACRMKCSLIPRVYSGAALDLCSVFQPDGGQGSAIMFYDLFLSIPIDSLILPYTVYGQITEGNLVDSKKCEKLKSDGGTDSNEVG